MRFPRTEQIALLCAVPGLIFAYSGDSPNETQLHRRQQTPPPSNTTKPVRYSPPKISTKEPSASSRGLRTAIIPSSLSTPPKGGKLLQLTKQSESGAAAVEDNYHPSSAQATLLRSIRNASLDLAAKSSSEHASEAPTFHNSASLSTWVLTSATVIPSRAIIANSSFSPIARLSKPLTNATTATCVASAGASACYGQPPPKNKTSVSRLLAPSTSAGVARPHSQHSSTSEACTPQPSDGRPYTYFSIVYTSTITVYGNMSEYPHRSKPLQTPHFCPPEEELDTGRGLDQDDSGGSDDDEAIGEVAESIDKASKPHTHQVLEQENGHGTAYHQPPITFITTDKSPSAAFATDPVPAYRPTDNAAYLKDLDSGDHDAAIMNENPPPLGRPTADAATFNFKPRSPIEVTARRYEIVIDGHTFDPGRSTLVTVGGSTFTFLPAAVVGEGVTVKRPAPAAGFVSAAAPTRIVLGGLSIAVEGRNAMVAGHTIPIPPQGRTTLVNGQVVSVGPGLVGVGASTLSFPLLPSRQQAELAVHGGELLTAIGRSILVLRSTTITYGPGIPATSEKVNADTVIIGSSGITVRGSLLGGPMADPTTTTHEIVGGATITKLDPSIAIIDRTTYTVGPGTHWTTTFLLGENYTIGPGGVIVSSMTLAYPFGPSVTATITPSPLKLNGAPVGAVDPLAESGGGSAETSKSEIMGSPEDTDPPGDADGRAIGKDSQGTMQKRNAWLQAVLLFVAVGRSLPT